jgi:hypothetical protein
MINSLLFSFSLTVSVFFLICLLRQRYKINDTCCGFLFYFLNIIIYGVIGVYLNSRFLCAISVIFLTIVLMFLVSVILPIRNANTEIIPVLPVLITAGFTTCLGILLYVLALPNNLAISFDSFGPFGSIVLFAPGMLWVGELELSLLLFRSSLDFYNTKTYVLNNIISIALFALCLYVGNLYEIDQLITVTYVMIIGQIVMKFYELLVFLKKY